VSDQDTPDVPDNELPLERAWAFMQMVVWLALGLASAVSIASGSVSEAAAALVGAVLWGVRAVRRY
jgi:hypothetical protein